MNETVDKPEPKLRFQEFSGAWHDGNANDAFANSKTKGQAGLPIYSVTLDQGLVPRSSLDRHMAADAADELNLRVDAGQLAYNMMRMWQGAVGVAPEDCMVSPAYVVLDPKEGTHSVFYDYWFKAPRMLYLLWAYSHGLTSDRLRLYFNDFAQIPLHLPSLSEQKKIADFLGAVDGKLAALREKEAALTRFKRGLMQALFSQTLRFTRDDGSPYPDWEEKRLGEVFHERVERGNIEGELLSVTLRDGIQKAVDVSRASSASADLSNYKTVCVGDIAYNSMRMWQGASGVSPYDGIVSPAYTVLNLRDDQNSEFWGYCFKLTPSTQMFQRYSQGLTSDTWNLKFPALSKIKMPVPNPEEQQKIADALSAMDAKIAAVDNQITHLTAFKTGLLQQMFV